MDDADEHALADAMTRHEIRNSLNAIALSVAVLSRGRFEDVAEAIEYVDAIVSAADRAIEVLDRAGFGA